MSIVSRYGISPLLLQCDGLCTLRSNRTPRAHINYLGLYLRPSPKGFTKRDACHHTFTFVTDEYSCLGFSQRSLLANSLGGHSEGLELKHLPEKSRQSNDHRVESLFLPSKRDFPDRTSTRLWRNHFRRFRSILSNVRRIRLNAFPAIHNLFSV